MTQIFITKKKNRLEYEPKQKKKWWHTRLKWDQNVKPCAIHNKENYRKKIKFISNVNLIFIFIFFCVYTSRRSYHFSCDFFFIFIFFKYLFSSFTDLSYGLRACQWHFHFLEAEKQKKMQFKAIWWMHIWSVYWCCNKRKQFVLSPPRQLMINDKIKIKFQLSQILCHDCAVFGLQAIK